MEPHSIHASSDADPVWVSAVPERAPGAELLSAGGDHVVMDGKGQLLRGLNTTGAAVWSLIDGIRPVVEIAAEISRRYSRPFPKVLKDVIAFVRALAETRLIHLRGEEVR